MNRKDLMKRLGISNKNASKLKVTAKKMMDKSFIEFENGDNFDMGFLFTRTKSDRNTVSIKVNKDYLPYLEELSSHFTQIYIDNIIGLTSKHAISLYMYLSSWFNPDYLIQNTVIRTNQLQRIFSLSDKQYWRDVETDHPRFKWSAFEKYVLQKAIDDINANKNCDIVITGYKKAKNGKDVVGYMFTWGPVERYKNGRVWAITDNVK